MASNPGPETNTYTQTKKSSELGRVQRGFGALWSVPLWILSLCSCDATGGKTWDELQAEIRAEFGDVSHITTQQLADWIAEERPVVLIDVRAEEEVAVSTIPGARNVPWAEDFVRRLGVLHPEHEIVFYCSVGYRSSLAARELSPRHDHVHNLTGSIFQWANEDRTLEGPGGAVQVVHPYDRSWGRYLDPAKRAEP